MGMGKSSPAIPQQQPQVVVPQSEDASVKMEEQKASAAARSREGTSAHLLSAQGFQQPLSGDDPDTQRKRLLAGNMGIG